MNSKEISQFIGKSALLRKAGYFLIKLTTLREWYVREALHEAASSLSPDFRFLDAGSGLGQHAIEIAHKYSRARVTGIEVDKDAVADCNDFVRKNGIANVEFVAKDIIEFSQHQAFDLILCCSVLEHIEEDTKVLASFYQSIKDGGRLIVYVPTSEQRVLPSLERRIHAMVRDADVSLPHDHVRYYQAKELLSKLQTAGFNIVKATKTYGPFGRLAYDIVTSVQYSPFFKWIFLLYLAFVQPFMLLLMWADFKRTNKEGNGLMIVAQKTAPTEEAASDESLIGAVPVPLKGWYLLGQEIRCKYGRAA